MYDWASNLYFTSHHFLKAIQAQQLPDDVATFFVQRIGSLPPDAKMALSVLSCFGASVSCKIIGAIETSLGIKVADPSHILVDEGLVREHDGRYIFCHDHIQEAAYLTIDEQECCIHHMKYGLCLVDLALQNGDSALLLTAVTQINIGGPVAVQEEELYSLIANYNLIAGKKAMECSDFASAFRFFDHGISFLRKKHWEESYAL
jgi:predicted ATPase